MDGGGGSFDGRLGGGDGSSDGKLGGGDCLSEGKGGGGPGVAVLATTVGAVVAGELGAGGARTTPHEVTPVPTRVQVQLS